MRESSLQDVAAEAVVALEESPVYASFIERHDIQAAPVLTVLTDEIAEAIARWLAPRIEGKIVVEIGGGVGLLAMYLADYAKQVFCIEANPVWSHAFVHLLLQEKPRNLSYLLGSAEEFAPHIKADVALFCSHSGIGSMSAAGRQLAPVCIDVYGEMIAKNPRAFDPLASMLRRFV